MTGRRVVFMGSADFAVPSLAALLDAGADVPLVVTRADKPSGRGLELSLTPVKRLAVDRGLSVFQPRGLRDPATWDPIRAARPDVIVVAAYGRILPPEVLAIPPRLPGGAYGCVNVHGSILPRHRGAAPIQRAVLCGDAVTGVTLMAMDEGLDTGGILAVAETPIAPDDTAASLFDRLAGLGAALLAAHLEPVLDGSCVPVAQDETNATVASILRKEEGRIDWSRPVRAVCDHVRGMETWPGAFTFAPGDLRLRVFPFLAPVAGGTSAVPGEVVAIGADGMTVRAGDGCVLVREVQPAGSRRMSPRDLAAGRRIRVGDVLGG